MKLHVEDLGEPLLEFGNGVEGVDPKTTLAKAGPFGASGQSVPKTVQLGLVAPVLEADAVRLWIDKMGALLLDDESNARRFRPFPGAPKALRCQFDLPDRFVRILDTGKFDHALAQDSNRSFELLLKLYGDSIESLFADQHPDCVLVCFPEAVATLRIANPRLSAAEQQVLTRAQQEEEDLQMSLFAPSPEEQEAAAELLPQAEELLFRNFHRALKARCMLMRNAVPIQIIRRQTYIPTEATQSGATRAWNLGVALYYKAGNIPWRPARLSSGTCFIGVSFHHLKRRSGDLVYASVAQAFSSDLEPFALKGQSVPREQTRGNQPYLTADQSADLVARVMGHYELHTGSRPTRVVVHKTSRFQPEENDGFGGALRDCVPAFDLIWMAPTSFRLLRRGMHEPLRATLCTLEDENYLFTMGYVPRWKEYPGPHIPSPIQIGCSSGAMDVRARAREIMSLTKMNWNSAEGIGRHPITITFAQRVGITMTEMDDDSDPNPLYRFYM